MNPGTFIEAKRLFEATKKIPTNSKKVELIIAPPHMFLRELSKGYRGTRIEFAAQDISRDQEGSHTGETSATQVHDTGSTHVIIGHAERRALGENEEDIHAKVLMALEAKLNPIIAIGESERDAHGDYIKTVRRQITTALDGIPAARFKNITIAYEPIWAIGAEHAPDAHAVHQMVLLVRKTLRDFYGEKAMKATRIVYGGSVNEENARDIFSVPELDGVLIGRASLDPIKFATIARAAAETSV